VVFSVPVLIANLLLSTKLPVLVLLFLSFGSLMFVIICPPAVLILKVLFMVFDTMFSPFWNAFSAVVSFPFVLKTPFSSTSKKNIPFFPFFLFGKKVFPNLSEEGKNDEVLETGLATDEEDEEPEQVIWGDFNCREWNERDLEVIGNIYENSNLLEQKDG
jgi:hypothetical protein